MEEVLLQYQFGDMRYLRTRALLNSQCLPEEERLCLLQPVLECLNARLISHT